MWILRNAFVAGFVYTHDLLLQRLQIAADKANNGSDFAIKQLLSSILLLSFLCADECSSDYKMSGLGGISEIMNTLRSAAFQRKHALLNVCSGSMENV